MRLKNPIATSNNILSMFPTHECVSILGKADYGAIEVWASILRKELDESTTTIEKIKEELKRQVMTGVVHAPLTDYKNPGKLNICSKDKELKERSLRLTLEAMEYTKKLGFDVIVIHPGHTDKEGEEADEEYWTLQIEAFKILAEKAEELGIKIGMEPMENRPKEFVMRPSKVDRLLNATGSKNLGLTFDLIHAYSHGVDAPLEFLEPFHKNIFHVHVSGHNKKKNHVPFSQSIISHLYLDKVLEELIGKYQGIISIEGSLKGIEELTKERQIQVIKENMAYIKKDIKSLHVL